MKNSERVRENVVNFLSKINWEGGCEQYFTSYSSAESAGKELYKAGVNPMDVAAVERSAEDFVHAFKRLESVLTGLRKKFNIEEEEVEC